MAVTIGNFTAINDSEVDAESPITESLMTRLRDNAYWVNAGTTKTTETTATKYLKPDGSGGVSWGDTSSLGVDGTKGVVAMGIISATATISIVANKILHIRHVAAAGNEYGTNYITIDNSDDSLIYAYHEFDMTGSYAGSNGNGSITVTGSYQSIGGGYMASNVRENGGNYEFYAASGTGSLFYYWL